MPGGTATSTVRTLDAVARRGNYDLVGIAASHRFPPSSLATPTIPVVHMPLGRRPLYEAWHRFRRPALGRRFGTIDVVHATGGVIPPHGDTPLVVTVHDLAFLHRPSHFTSRGVAFMTRSFELAKAEAAMISVPSQATAGDCVDHGVDPDRIALVPWGADPVAVTESDRKRVRDVHRLPDDFVLWVGTAEPRKNLTGLAEAMSRIDVPLVLAGPPGWGVDVDALTSNSRVRHIGELSGADLPVLLDLATVFALPSLLEGFGMPVLEAMAQGTAVVTSAGTSTEEIVGPDGVTVDPHDTEELGDAIGRLLLDDEHRRVIAEAGRVRAAGMTWDATASLTEDVYRRALG